MKYIKLFKRTIFSEEVLRKTIAFVEKLSGEKLTLETLLIKRDDHSWDLDNLDDFFIEYNHGFVFTYFVFRFGNNLKVEFNMNIRDYFYEISITAQTREEINQIINLLDSNQGKCNIDRLFSKSQKPNIFIGHGQKPDWKELRDHLRDKHKYELKFYESSDKTSGYIFENVFEMIDSSRIGILIFSKDDSLEDGSMRTRQNVIHELGLSQAKLGRENTVIILEGGCEWPSNIQGIDILIYENSIKEIFGDLISAIEKRMYRLFLENEKYSA